MVQFGNKLHQFEPIRLQGPLVISKWIKCLMRRHLVFTILRRESLEFAALVTLLLRLPVNYRQLYHEILWPFDHVNDS